MDCDTPAFATRQAPLPDADWRGSAMAAKQKELRSHDAEELRRALRLRRVFHVLPGGVVVLDGCGIVEECNPTARALLGDPIKGQLWRDVVARAIAPRWDDGHDVTLQSGRRVNISTQALFGDEPGQIVLIQDVTETRQLQDQLHHYQRLASQGDMAARLAHQIRTPLSAAILYLSNLARSKLDDATRQRFLGKIKERLGHLEKIVEDMLLFARGDTSAFSAVEVAGLVDDFARDAVASVHTGGFVLETSNLAPGASLYANRNALLSVFQNLVNNAVEACGAGGKLRLEVTAEADMVEFCFSDNGPGISAAIRERLFQPFVSTRAQGTGLGLAVAQTVVRSHGGTIAAEPNSPCGSKFRIRLPIVRNPHGKGAASQAGAD